MNRIAYISAICLFGLMMASCGKDEVESPDMAPAAKSLVLDDDGYSLDKEKPRKNEGDSDDRDLTEPNVNDDGDDESGNPKPPHNK